MRQQDKYNKENYRLLTLKHELDVQREEQPALQSKEMELLVREELLQAKVSLNDVYSLHICVHVQYYIAQWVEMCGTCYMYHIRVGESVHTL